MFMLAGALLSYEIVPFIFIRFCHIGDMIETFRAAKTICNLSKWKISNLSLQKLLYLAHMVHLGQHRERLIDGNFEAWNLGPVEPSLYHKVKPYGSQPIPDIFPCWVFEPDSIKFKSICSVYDQLKNAAPGQLVAITHEDNGAWAKNFKPNIFGIIIPDRDILNEYVRRMSA